MQQFEGLFKEAGEKIVGLETEASRTRGVIEKKDQELEEMGGLRMRKERQDTEMHLLEETLRSYEKRIVLQSQEVERVTMINASINQEVEE